MWGNIYICISVCLSPPQSDGAAVGFISVTSDVDLKQLQENFDLSEFDGLYKRTKDDDEEEQRNTEQVN